MNEIEFVTYKQFDSCAYRLEKHNLKRYNQSLTAGSIARHGNPYIIEIQPDRKGMLIRLGWREAMKRAAFIPPKEAV